MKPDPESHTMPVAVSTWDRRHEYKLRMSANVNGASLDISGYSRGLPSSGEFLASVSTPSAVPAGFDLSPLAFVLKTGTPSIASLLPGVENFFRTTGGEYTASRTLNLREHGQLTCEYRIERDGRARSEARLNFRRKRRLVALAIASCLLAGCGDCNGGGGLDVDNDIDPAGGTPKVLLKGGGADGQTALWRVRWDNPPVQGQLTLGFGHAAWRGNPAWTYTRFDLTLDDGEKGLLPWPANDGSWDTSTPKVFWEAHGLALPPRISLDPGEGIVTLQAKVQDADIGAPKPYLGPGLFQLDPTVILIPLHIIVTHPTSGNTAAFPPAWLPEATVRALFDDVWTADKQVLNNPNEHPHSVTGTWAGKTHCDDPASTLCSAGFMAMPDRIWDQCNIQFRVVSYTTCPVPADAFDNLTLGGDCTGQAQATLINKAIEGCTVNNGAVNVAIVGTLNDWGYCNKVYGLSKKAGTMYLGAGITTSPFVVAHELGHKLDLPDIGDDEGCATPSLMCQAVEAETPILEGCAGVAPNCGACDHARERASYLQGLYLW